MASVGLRLIRGLLHALLIFIFIFAGAAKVSDKFFPKEYVEMQSQFVRFAKVHPAVLFGYEIDPVKYMRQIGVIEIAGGILLVGPRIFKMFSCLMLSSIMIGAMYTLHQLKEPMSKIAAPAIVLLLLFLRLHFLLIGNVKEHSAQKTEKKE